MKRLGILTHSALAALGILGFTQLASAQATVVSDLTLARTVTLTGAGTLHGLDVASDGRVFVIGGGGTDLYVLNTDDSFTRIAQNAGTFQGVLSDLRLGPDGLLYAVSTGASPAPVQRFALDGTAQSDLASITDGADSNAAGVGFDCVGNLYASDTSASISKVTPAGVVSTVNSTPFTFQDVDEIESGGNNVLFISDGSARTADQDTIWRMAPDGQVTKYAEISGTQLYSGAFDFAKGVYYVASYNTGQIYRLIDTNGNQRIDDASEQELVASGFATSEASDIAIGPSSAGGGYSIYVSGTNKIYEISGLGVPSGDCGDRIDDDRDGFCEIGRDTNNDGDCLDAGEDDGSVDCDDTDNTRFPGATELCDGKDNDCDNSTDEDFTTLGDGCSDGVGACMASGFVVCDNAMTGVICDAVPGTPGTEVCGNSVDEDCDGALDNGCGTGGAGGTGGTSTGGTGGSATGGTGGSATGGTGGATTGGAGGTTSGGAGGSGGATSGGAGGATSGGAGGTTGGSAGMTSGGSAGMTSGGAAGSAGATSGGAAGTSSGGSAGAATGGSAGSSVAGSANGGSATGGSTSGGSGGLSAGGAAGAGGSNGGNADTVEGGGCGCSTPGQKAPNGGLAGLLLAAGAVLLRRRRRSAR